MAKEPKEAEDQTGEKLQVNTARLETLADAATGIAQARKWQARKNGLSDNVESSEVRNLSDDQAARAAAGGSLRKLMRPSGHNALTRSAVCPNRIGRGFPGFCSCPPDLFETSTIDTLCHTSSSGGHDSPPHYEHICYSRTPRVRHGESGTWNLQ
jgi:hypothetical protein